ncbi:MAG: RelA/SpoT domain-containing protein, partial [Patescibacteria group bacterium]
MRYPDVPDYSKSKVDKAGDIIRSSKPDSDEYRDALNIVNDWRVCHAYPVNTFVATLRKKVRKYKDPIVAQRLKRLPTIVNKLDREPSMKLSRMHDIAGVRGVVKTMDDLNKLVGEYKRAKFLHELKNTYDYIDNPKLDGYRSVHLVYKYCSTSTRTKQYEGLQIELQLRTRLQHDWATALETISTFRNESFKTGGG